MLRYILLSKLHRGTVTECDLNYNGSIKIDPDLLDLAGMRPWERVEIFNVNNGARFSTYIIEGERGSGEIGINGAAARMAMAGDKVIVINYGLMDDREAEGHQPRIVILDDNNKPVE